MPHVDQLPDSSRFFGRVDSFHCECPACGAMIFAHAEGDTPAGATARRPRPKLRKPRTFNAITSRLTCPGCSRQYGIGLLAWPIEASPQAIEPADHRPTPRERAALRQQAIALWPTRKKRQGAPLNLYLRLPCTCPRGGWKAQCPVHSWEAFWAARETPDPPKDPST